MENTESLQRIKEQFKVQSQELKKVKEEKDKVAQDLHEQHLTFQNEIKLLRESIDEKNRKIASQQFRSHTAGEPKSVAAEPDIDASSATATANLDENTLAEIHPDDANLKEKLKSLKNRTRQLKEQIELIKQTNRQLENENFLINQELRHSHKDSTSSGILDKRIESLRNQLKLARDAALSSGQATADIVREKDSLIEKYETMIYGEALSDQKGISPAVLIKNLRQELEELETEKDKMFQEMELLKQDNEQMESKVFLLEEKDLGGKREYRANAESRAAVSSEFSAGLESFLITYSDLITLILVIFVLLYSVSQLDDGKFVEAFSSFQEKEMRVENLNIRLSVEEFKMLKRVRELVKDNVDPESLVRSDVKTILVRLPSENLFAPGSAELKDGAEEFIIDSVKTDMKDGVKQVYVDGHTDDVPLKPNQEFPSNWELSSVRASHVARVLIDKLNFAPDRIVVTGYGQYRPFKPNDSDKNRALNRRVELKILKDKAVTDQEQTPSLPSLEKKVQPEIQKILPNSTAAAPKLLPENP